MSGSKSPSSNPMVGTITWVRVASKVSWHRGYPTWRKGSLPSSQTSRIEWMTASFSQCQSVDGLRVRMETGEQTMDMPPAFSFSVDLFEVAKSMDAGLDYS